MTDAGNVQQLFVPPDGAGTVLKQNVLIKGDVTCEKTLTATGHLSVNGNKLRTSDTFGMITRGIRVNGASDVDLVANFASSGITLGRNMSTIGTITADGDISTYGNIIAEGSITANGTVASSSVALQGIDSTLQVDGKTLGTQIDQRSLAVVKRVLRLP